jgi:NADH:ubiquinone oxidoreductase subunit 5 (subunit L)/multisubunit Na+/H+ antiporter MnhA subunit
MALGDISILEAQIRKPNSQRLKRFRKFIRKTAIFTLTSIVLPLLLTLLVNVPPFGTFWVLFCLFHILKYRTPSHSKLAILFAVLLLLVALATVVMNIYGVFFAKKIHEKIFYRKAKITGRVTVMVGFVVMVLAWIVIAISAGIDTLTKDYFQFGGARY